MAVLLSSIFLCKRSTLAKVQIPKQTQWAQKRLIHRLGDQLTICVFVFLYLCVVETKVGPPGLKRSFQQQRVTTLTSCHLQVHNYASSIQPHSFNLSGDTFRLRVDLCTVVQSSEFLATLFYNCHPPSCRLYLTKVHADFNCDVHFPDLAPFGFPINSANTNLEGLQTDLKLVPVEDDDVQVLSLRYKSALIRGLKHIKQNPEFIRYKI